MQNQSPAAPRDPSVGSLCLSDDAHRPFYPRLQMWHRNVLLGSFPAARAGVNLNIKALFIITCSRSYWRKKKERLSYSNELLVPFNPPERGGMRSPLQALASTSALHPPSLRLF